MISLSRVWLLVVSSIILSYISSAGVNCKESVPVNIVIRTNSEKYSLNEKVKLYVSFENVSDQPIFIDRRMLLGGPVYGLTVEVRDESGNPLQFGNFSDALLPPPPPRENDNSILIRLEDGFFYGRWVNLKVSDIFKKPGTYSIRVSYKSWLHKDSVSPQLQDLPALWSDTPTMSSKPIRIEITQ